MTGQIYKVKFRASCKSSNIVYFITCRRCGLQYVGKTSQPLHAWINGHLSDITHQMTDVSPVAEHFNSSAHSGPDTTVMVIELSPKEGRWIRTMENSSLSGMNPRVEPAKSWPLFTFRTTPFGFISLLSCHFILLWHCHPWTFNF